MLYEGVGAEEAASPAFDSQKLGIEKFSIGPAAVKDDMLLVRFGVLYFQCDVTAPTVIGIVLFGVENI